MLVPVARPMGVTVRVAVPVSVLAVVMSIVIVTVTVMVMAMNVTFGGAVLAGVIVGAVPGCGRRAGIVMIVAGAHGWSVSGW
jgi:hypothetical protein